MSKPPYIDHNPLNYSPDNLKIMSQSEHAKLHFAGIKRPPKTVCIKSHPLDSSNTMITSAGRRRCLTCNRQYDNAWKKHKRISRGLKRPGVKKGSCGWRKRDQGGRFAYENN